MIAVLAIVYVMFQWSHFFSEMDRDVFVGDIVFDENGFQWSHFFSEMDSRAAIFRPLLIPKKSRFARGPLT